MKASTIKYSVLSWTLSLVSLIIALIPFHAFLTIWASTFVGHYTAVRLWKEVLIALVLVGVLYLVAFDHKVRQHTLRRKLTWLIITYLLVQLIWGAVAYARGGVTHLAVAYGLLLNCRFLVFFLLTWAVAVRTDRLEKRWPKLLLWPAVIVVTFGLLEVFVLPNNFLSHFGYGSNTISPIATINHNSQYLRYMSTLRGANPLGAYLLIPISALVVLLLRYPRSWGWARGLLLAGSIAMLFFSFSRSAWIGAVLATIAAVVIVYGKTIWQKYRLWLGIATALFLAICVAGALSLRGDTSFQNFILHTQSNSSVKSTSNGAHLSALTGGAKDIVHHPFGHGPGSAGPASEYNNHRGRIAEDYYIQVGQETGVVGLVLFLAILGAVAYILWTRRAAPLALALLVALIGISFVNLLSHAWTDDTLAYLWWGLAGLAVGTPIVHVKTSRGPKTN